MCGMKTNLDVGKAVGGFATMLQEMARQILDNDNLRGG